MKSTLPVWFLFFPGLYRWNTLAYHPNTDAWVLDNDCTQHSLMFKWDSTHATSRDGGALWICSIDECTPQIQAMEHLEIKNERTQHSQPITFQYSSFHFETNSLLRQTACCSQNNGSKESMFNLPDSLPIHLTLDVFMHLKAAGREETWEGA